MFCVDMPGVVPVGWPNGDEAGLVGFGSDTFGVLVVDTAFWVNGLGVGVVATGIVGVVVAVGVVLLVVVACPN